MDGDIMRDSVIEEKTEKFGAGLVGAFLFSLVGAILWYVIYQLGFIAGISGAVGVICAIRGYSFFSGKESKRGIVFSVIIAVLVIAAAWYLCLSTDVYEAYKEFYANGEAEFELSFFESVRSAYLFLAEPEIAAAYFKDLVIGIIFCAAAAFRPILSAVRKSKAESADAAVIPTSEETESISDDNSSGTGF